VKGVSVDGEVAVDVGSRLCSRQVDVAKTIVVYSLFHSVCGHGSCDWERMIDGLSAIRLLIKTVMTYIRHWCLFN